MTYNNLENKQTSLSAVWATGSSISFSTLGLDSSIPFKDQIEVERIFPLTTEIRNVISTADLHRIFLVPKDKYTVTGSTISAINFTGSETFTLTGTATTVTIPVISSGQTVIIRRKTLSMDKYITWVAGSRLTSEQLNMQTEQLLRLNQELLYKVETEYVRAADLTGSSAPQLSFNNALNMNSNRIINLAAPVDTNDGVTKGYVIDNAVFKTGAQTIAGNKTFSDTTTFTGAVAANGGFTCDSTAFSVADGTGSTSIGGNLTVTGQTILNGGLVMDTDKFTVADNTGNTTIAGTLAVTGTQTNITNNVGIGVAPVSNTNATKTLHIHSTNTTNIISELRLTNSTTGSTANSGLVLQTSGINSSLWNYSAGAINIGTNNSQRINIDSSGDTHFGTGTYATLNNIVVDILQTGRIRLQTDTSNYVLEVRDSGAPSVITAGLSRLGDLVLARDLSLTSTSGSTFKIGSGSFSGSGNLLQASSGTLYIQNETAGSDVFRAYTNNTNTASIQANGVITTSSLAGSGNRAVYSSASGVLTNSSSDGTLKTNIETISNSSELVSLLRPVKYNWIDTSKFGSQKEIGLIAQEVQPILPEVIGLNNDGTLSIDYPKIVSILIGAIQDLQNRINTLEQTS